ncbi:MAG: HNH endonuclease [Candidatus Kapaibacteriales bacterium]
MIDEKKCKFVRNFLNFLKRFTDFEVEIEKKRQQSPNVLNFKVLVLNQSYEPISVCTVRKAILLLLKTKAELVSKNDGNVISSVNKKIPIPSIIRLSKYIYIPKKKIELSRKNILRRDGYQCQYCGVHSTYLTVDHIIPKSRGGADSWDNLVTACISCNNKKGNQTPEEAGLKLIRPPRKPNHILFIRSLLGKINDDWKPYLFID